MTAEMHIDDGEIGSWAILFRPLASSRCEEFLAEAGVPEPMLRAMGGLRGVARRFLWAFHSAFYQTFMGAPGLDERSP